jgi:hypothetical protein
MKPYSLLKASEKFANGKSFKDRDMYIIVYDLNGRNLAQGANPKLVAKELQILEGCVPED